MNWRLRSVLAEGLLNLTAKSTRTLVLVLATGTVLGLVAAAELSSIVAVADDAHEFEAQGINVVVVSTDSAPLNGSRCLELNELQHVAYAGTITMRGQTSFARTPGVLYQVAEFAGPTAMIWDPTADEVLGGPLIGHRAATELGLIAGSSIRIEDGHVTSVVGVFNPTRNEVAARWVLNAAVPEESVDECWVEIQGNYASAIRTLPAWFGVDDMELRDVVSRENYQSPEMQFLLRTSRHSWIAAGGLLVLLAWIVTLGGRSDIALYRTLGMRTENLMTLGWVEVLIPATLGLVLGTLTAVSVHAGSGSLTVSLLWPVCQSVGSAWAIVAMVAPCLYTMVGRRSVAAFLRGA